MAAPTVILYRNLGPYHLARLRALARLVPDLVAVELADRESAYGWRSDKRNAGVRVHTLFDGSLEAVPERRMAALAVAFLEHTGPAALVVAGYSDLAMRRAAGWARRHGVPCVMTTDTTALDRPRRWWRERVKAHWCRRFYAALALPGERSASYYASLGFPAHRIVRTSYPVDNEFFAQGAARVRADAAATRLALGLPDRCFLTTARLCPEKNLGRLIHAYGDYRRHGGSWDLVLAGDGPLSQTLREQAARGHVPGVHFAGWVPYERLPEYYGLASCFVLPSLSEPWGLVVNEAMACGLPALVSDRCGCVPELCRDGVTGFVFDPYDSDGLAALMRRTEAADLAAMGRAAGQTVAAVTLERWAAAMRRCLQNASRVSCRTPGGTVGTEPDPPRNGRNCPMEGRPPCRPREFCKRLSRLWQPGRPTKHTKWHETACPFRVLSRVSRAAQVFSV